MDKNDRAFPNITSVDPINCGCTECCTGEYVNEDTWVSSANAADLAAVVSGDVTNNTLNSTFSLILTNYFDNESANEFARNMREEIEKDFHLIDTDKLMRYL